MKKWWPVAVLSLFLAACSSFGTTRDRWTDRYQAQENIFKHIHQIKQERLEFLTRLLGSLEGESRGFLIAMIAMDGDYRDYADVLAAVTPPARTSGEILAQGVADVLPFAVFGASMGWVTNEWAHAADRGPPAPMTDNRVSYHSGGDMGFSSWNPSTVTTTTSTLPVPGGP